MRIKLEVDGNGRSEIVDLDLSFATATGEATVKGTYPIEFARKAYTALRDAFEHADAFELLTSQEHATPAPAMVAALDAGATASAPPSFYQAEEHHQAEPEPAAPRPAAARPEPVRRITAPTPPPVAK